MINPQVDIDLYIEPGSWRSIFMRATRLALTGEKILIMDLVLEDNLDSDDVLLNKNGFTILRFMQPNPSQVQIIEYVNDILSHTGSHYDRIIVYSPEKWSAELHFLLRP